MPFADAAKRRTYSRLWVQKFRARFKNAGGCSQCGQPVERFDQCNKHRVSGARRCKEYRARKRRVMKAAVASVAAIVALAVAMFSPALLAQTTNAFPNSKILYGVTGIPDLAAANGLTIRAYDGAATTGTVLSGHTCTTTTTAGAFDCSANLPALSAGPHTITLTAAFPNSSESGKSNALNFTMIVFQITIKGLQ